MKWYKKLYVGESASHRKTKIIRKIKFHKKQVGIYVLVLPANDKNVLDIYPSYVLNQKHFKKSQINIIGIAVGRDEAFQVMQNILMDCYNKTNHFHISQLVSENDFIH